MWKFLRKEKTCSRCPFEAVGRPIAFPRCPGTWRRCLRFQNGFNFSKNASQANPPDSHNVVMEQPVAEPKEKTPDDTRVSSEEESTDLLKVARRNRPEARRDRAHHPHKLGDATKADHKLLGEENVSLLQHRHAVVVPDLDSHWTPSYTTNNAQETLKHLQKFVPSDQKLVLYIQIILWSLLALVKT